MTPLLENRRIAGPLWLSHLALRCLISIDGIRSVTCALLHHPSVTPLRCTTVVAFGSEYFSIVEFSPSFARVCLGQTLRQRCLERRTLVATGVSGAGALPSCLFRSSRSGRSSFHIGFALFENNYNRWITLLSGRVAEGAHAHPIPMTAYGSRPLPSLSYDDRNMRARNKR